MMTKFLFVGDLHFSETNPRNYISDYKQDFKIQMKEVYDLAETHSVEAILTSGDVFNFYDVANSTLIELVKLFDDSPIKWYSIIGDHDMIGYNIDGYARSSLRLLTMICDKFKVIFDDHIRVMSGAVLTGTNYSKRIDINGFGYEPGIIQNVVCPKIHLSHGMLLDHVPLFEKYTHINNLKTTVDIVLNGHFHDGMLIYYKNKNGIVIKCNNGFEWTSGKGTVVCNPGAFMRQKATKTELERQIQVALINIEGKRCKIELIPLQSAKPGYEVLSCEAIEQNEECEYAMSELMDLIQSKLDILQVEEINNGKSSEKIIEKVIKLITEMKNTKETKKQRF